MAEKYIYAPTTHGNYAIVRMDMKPRYNGFNIIDRYSTPEGHHYSQWVSGIKSSYPIDECFDTIEDAEKFAKKQISMLRDKMISDLEKKVKYIQNKMDRLGNTDPKVHYFNWIKNG